MKNGSSVASPPSGPAGKGAAIITKKLRKLYPPDVWAVNGVDLEILEGECFGLLGPNGAGKTTTVEILEGLLEPTSGEIAVLGRSWDRNGRELRELIGISLQETLFPERLTVGEIIRLFRSFYREGMETEEAIRLVGLEEKSQSWAGNLSGGQKKRLEIACALVGRPLLLFLDEPTTGLDPASRRQVWEIVHSLRAGGRTILLTTHYMDEAEKLCDRVAIIDRGRVIALGTPAELIAGLGAEHVIEFAVTGERDGDASSPDLSSRDAAVAAGAEPALDPELLGSLAGVRGVRWNGASIFLTVSEPHVTLPALLGTLERNGYGLRRLTTRHASLEDVFVRLTGRHLGAEDHKTEGDIGGDIDRGDGGDGDGRDA